MNPALPLDDLLTSWVISLKAAAQEQGHAADL